MGLDTARNFLDKQGIVYDIDDVAAGTHTSGQTSKFWPYKLAGMMIFGELPGIKKLPGRVVIAPLPVLCKVCPVKKDIVKEYIKHGQVIGFFDHVEFYTNHALVVVAPTPWETGMLDFPPSTGGQVTTVGSNTIPPTHP